VAVLAALVAAGMAYVSSPLNPHRSEVAGLAAVFAFVMGVMASAVMTSILTSATRTVFVCWAMNPLALQQVGGGRPESG
jgi:hypothetical protein